MYHPISSSSLLPLGLWWSMWDLLTVSPGFSPSLLSVYLPSHATLCVISLDPSYSLLILFNCLSSAFKSVYYLKFFPVLFGFSKLAGSVFVASHSLQISQAYLAPASTVRVVLFSVGCSVYWSAAIISASPLAAFPCTPSYL